MKKISNEFVTIEYNERNEQIANYYMDLFNSDKKFYKGILNGKTLIRDDEFIKCFFNPSNEDYSYFYNQELINSILKFSNAEPHSFIEPLHGDLYFAVKETAIENMDMIPNERNYFQLAYNYFLKTKDFTFLKKCLFDNDINIDDLFKLCDYTVLYDFDKLLRSKIQFDISLIENFPEMNENLGGYLKILSKIYDDVGVYIKQMTNTLSSNNVSFLDLLTSDLIPAIDKKEFDQLVRESINYIDPSNKLMEYYDQMNEDGKLFIKKSNSMMADNCYFLYDFNDENYGIYISATDKIIDVLTFMHEFGHLCYTFIDKKNLTKNVLFSEYPSIYFELKTAEYLVKKGYEKDKVDLARFFRLYGNVNGILYMIPTLMGVYMNRGKAPEDYNLENVSTFINKLSEITPDSLTQYGLSEEQINEMIISTKLEQSYRLLSSSSSIIDEIKYLIGSYLSEYSIENLSNEQVFDNLHKIRFDNVGMNEVLEMHGIDPKQHGFKKVNMKIMSLKQEKKD